MSATADGLVGSVEWHRDRVKQRKYKTPQADDRAILFQSSAHISELVARFPRAAHSLAQPASFAENVCIDARLNRATVCIGDEFHIVRAQRIVGALQVSCPRLPCAKVDSLLANGMRQ